MTKDHILSEIRRTAAENGGIPLGRERFLDETGIKSTDWRGKYWVRWADAIKEAGFQPNLFQSAIPDEELLRSLAEFVGELGHFPVWAEIRMKAYNTPGFPHHTTFSRYGGIRALETRLRTYFLEQGATDLAALCVVGDDKAAPSGPLPEPSPDADLGFVYPMKSGRFYKIGRTNAVGRRERELAIQLPEKVKVIHSIKTDDPAGIEEYWHKRFRDRHKNGEWYELTPQDVAAFRRRKFM